MKKSIIRRILMLMLIQIILSISALCIFMFFSYVDTKNEILQSSQNFLQVYGKEISNRLERVNTVLEGIIYQNSNLIQLESPKELERYYASRAISSQLKEVMATDGSAEILVVAQGQYEICLDAESTAITYNQRQAVRQFVLDAAKEGQSVVRWDFARIGEKAYIYKMYQKNTRIEAAFISADSLLGFIQGADYGRQIFVLTDQDGIRWALMGEEESDRTLEQKINIPFYQEIRRPVVEGQVYLSAYVNHYNIFSSAKYSVYIIAFLAVVNALYVIGTVKYMRKQLLTPIQNITGVMDEIREGNYGLRIEGTFENLENFAGAFS